MARATNNPASRHRRKKWLKAAKGNWGRRKSLIRTARETVEKGMAYSTRDRLVRKRDFRRLWIVRLNAAVRDHGMSYSQFMGALKRANIEINRKVLSELAINEPDAFRQIVDKVKEFSNN